MRNSNDVFSAGERKVAIVALVGALALAVGGIAIDRFTGPSLGVYGQEISMAAPGGVMDAQPIG